MLTKDDMGFGAQLPDKWKPEQLHILWGGRAIWNSNSGFFDIPHDRQQMRGGADPERKLFATWVTKVALPRVSKWALRVSGSSTEVFEWEDLGDGVTRGICATPNASYGYMYIRAWERLHGEEKADGPGSGPVRAGA